MGEINYDDKLQAAFAAARHGNDLSVCRSAAVRRECRQRVSEPIRRPTSPTFYQPLGESSVRLGPVWRKLFYGMRLRCELAADSWLKAASGVPRQRNLVHYFTRLNSFEIWIRVGP